MPVVPPEMPAFSSITDATIAAERTELTSNFTDSLFWRTDLGRFENHPTVLTTNSQVAQTGQQLQFQNNNYNPLTFEAEPVKPIKFEVGDYVVPLKNYSPFEKNSIYVVKAVSTRDSLIDVMHARTGTVFGGYYASRFKRPEKKDTDQIILNLQESLQNEIKAFKIKVQEDLIYIEKLKKEFADDLQDASKGS